MTRAQIRRGLRNGTLLRYEGKIRSRQSLKKERDFQNKVCNAANQAYAEQERRTCDPDVKKAVFQAVEQMKAMILDLPWSRPPVTFGDVARVAGEIGRQL